MTFTEAKLILDEVRKIPYPELKDVKVDLKFADRMYSALSGEISELTAITQYVYQHMVVDYKDLSKIMLEISITEMHHLDIIGELIKDSGRKPYYITDKSGRAWKSSFVYYETRDLIKTMEENIKSEYYAIDEYNKDKTYTDNKSIKSMFDRIIEDEKSHIRIFKKVIEDLKNNKQT